MSEISGRSEDRAVLSILISLIVLFMCMLIQYVMLWQFPVPAMHFLLFMIIFSWGLSMTGPIRKWQDAGRTRMHEFFSVFTALCFYGSGAMLSYILSGQQGVNLMLPAFTLLPLVYLYRSAFCVLLYEAACGVFLVATPGGAQLPVFFAALLTLIPYAKRLYSLTQQAFRIKLFELGTALSGVLFFLNHGQQTAYGIWSFALYSYFLALLMLHYSRYERGTPYFESPLKMIGIAGMIVLWLYNAKTERWLTFEVPGPGWSINIILFLILIVVCALFAENVLRGKISLEQLAFICAFFLSFGVYFYFEFYSPGQMEYINYYFMILLLAAGVLGAMTGIRRQAPLLIYIWTLILIGGFSWLLLADAFLETLIPAMAGGLLLLLAVGQTGFLRKKSIRRQFVDKRKGG